jgi:hypothetical protein
LVDGARWPCDAGAGQRTVLERAVKRATLSLALVLAALLIVRGTLYSSLLFWDPLLWELALAATLAYWVPLLLSVALFSRGLSSPNALIIPIIVFVIGYIAYNMFRAWTAEHTFLWGGTYHWKDGVVRPLGFIFLIAQTGLEGLLNILVTRLIHPPGPRTTTS